MITDGDIKRIKEIYRLPFKYVKEGQMVFDAKNRMVVDVRGWGFLQKFTDGERIQDNIGQLIVDLLNEKLKPK